MQPYVVRRATPLARPLQDERQQQNQPLQEKTVMQSNTAAALGCSRPRQLGVEPRVVVHTQGERVPGRPVPAGQTLCTAAQSQPTAISRTIVVSPTSAGTNVATPQLAPWGAGAQNGAPLPKAGTPAAPIAEGDQRQIRPRLSPGVSLAGMQRYDAGGRMGSAIDHTSNGGPSVVCTGDPARFDGRGDGGDDAPQCGTSDGDDSAARSSSALPQSPPSPLLRPFEAARQLLRSAAERGALTQCQGLRCRRRERRCRVRTEIPDACLQHLMCFIDNSRLQSDVQEAEELCDQHAREIFDVERERGDMAAKLDLEIYSLLRRLEEPADAPLGEDELQGIDRVCLDEETLNRERERVDALRHEVDDQRAKLEEAQTLALEARRNAAHKAAELTVRQMTRLGELDGLRRRLDERATVEAHAPAMVPTGLALVGGAAAYGVGTTFVDDGATGSSVSADAGSVRPGKFANDCLVAGQLRIVALRMELRRCCENLQGPACLVFSALQQPALPRLPTRAAAGSVEDAADLASWLEALGVRLAGLAQDSRGFRASRGPDAGP